MTWKSKAGRRAPVVLGSREPKDDRRLLVAMVGASGAGQWTLESYPIKRNLADSYDDTSFGTGQRLKYELEAVEPGFKVLLYPYRDGQPLPTFTATADTLQIATPGQTDRFSLSLLPSGRTLLSLPISNPNPL